MSDFAPFVGIDIGSSTVSVVVAIEENGELRIEGCGEARHDGAKKGMIANLTEVAEAVKTATLEAEAMASVVVEEASVGIGGTAIQGMTATASVKVTGPNQTVTVHDQQGALLGCGRISIPEDYHVLEIVPCGYTLDGEPGVEHPVGMPGVRLDASAYVLFCPKNHAERVEQVVNHAGIEVRQITYEPFAAAESVLSVDERELGSLLLDIGLGSTEWVLYDERAVVTTGATPVAGRHFTSDLAVLLKTTTAAAERCKREVGASLRRPDLAERGIEVPSLGGDHNQFYSQQLAAEILYERGHDLLVQVHEELVRQQLAKVPRAGIVLTGGGARLDGLVGLAEEVFGHPARLGSPGQIPGVHEPVSGPEWAVACGLVLLQQRRRRTAPPQQRGGRRGVRHWIQKALEGIFIMGGES